MENSWQTKRGALWRQPYLPPPTLPPTTPPLVASSLLDSHTQLSNADCRLYCQSIQDSVGMTPDHVLPNMRGLQNLGHSELGASFLSLISGPLAYMPCDQQHLLDPNTVPVSNKLPPSLRTAHGFTGGNRVSVLPGVPWLHNMDHPYLTSGEIFPPPTLSNTSVNDSKILQAASLDVQKSQTVACQTSHEKDKAMGFYPSIANNTSITRVKKYAHITASQKIPGESNTSALNNSLRVTCSGISGTLLLSDVGLLGVVCACHGLYMSISKFSEHSGSRDVDPGNAVCMDTGETVAHWRKAFTSRTGIRLADRHREWDWPEEISVSSGLTNQPICSMPNIPITFNQVSSKRASVSYEQKNQCVINSKENQSHRNIVDECIYHERDRPPEEYTNSLFKYITNSSHENLPHAIGHVRGLANSFCALSEKASAFEISCESRNSLPAFPNLQDLKTSCNGFGDGGKNSLNVDRPGVSSSIELRLGQLPEKNRTMEYKHQLPIETNLNGVHEDPSKVFFQDKLLQTSNVWQGSRSTLQHADIYSNPPERRGPTELEHSRCLGGAYGSITDCWKNSSDISLETNSIYCKLLSGFRNPQTKCQLRNNYENSSDNHVGEKKCYESKASEIERIYLPWNSLAGPIKEFGMCVPTTPNDINDDKEVGCDRNGMFASAKENIEVSKEMKGKASNFNLVLGETSTAFQVKGLDVHHMSTMTVDKLYGRGFLNNSGNTFSFSDTTHLNSEPSKHNQNPIVSEETPNGFSPKSSVFVYNAAPTLRKEKSTIITNSVQYRNVEMPAALNMLGISDGDNGPPVISVQECDNTKNPCIQSTATVAPSISKDPIKLLDSLKMPKFQEIRDKSTLSSCWMGPNCERFHTMAGRSFFTEDSVLTPMEQLSLRARGTECCFANCNKEHSSQGFSYAYVPEKHLPGQNDLNEGTFCNFLKGDRSGAAAARILYSKLNADCVFLKETAKSSDRVESLMTPNIKSAESCSFQWRDVPKKVKKNCRLIRKEQEAVSCSPLGLPAADVTKFFTGFSQIAVPFKEQEVSNISSGCSAPDVNQPTSEVNKKDSSTTALRNISFADSIVLDKRSGNGRSCSSDDGLDSEFCPEFYGSASKINLIKREPFTLVPRKPSLSLIEEIRLQNSLQSKSSSHKTKRSYTFCDDSDHLQKLELVPKKKRKTIKWMKLDVSSHASVNNKIPKCSEEVAQNGCSFLDKQMQLGCDQGIPSNCEDSVKKRSKHINSAFSAAKWVFHGKDFKRIRPQGEQQETNEHKSVTIDDALKASEMFRKKRLRLNDAFARRSEIRGVFYSSAELTAKLASLGERSKSFSKSNFQKWMVRPTVYGKYGIISNGNPSKPTKLIPLSEVLKTAVRISGEGNKKTDYDGKLKSTSVKVKKMSGGHARESSWGKKVLKNRVKKCRTHISQPNELESSENEELDSASCSATNGSDYPSYALQKCNNHGITDRKPEDKLKAKFKEGRQRSLHELLFKDYSSEVVNSSFMKNSSSSHQRTSRYCGEVMANDVDDRGQASERNKATGCLEKHQGENSGTFCCVYGGSDKDEHNQLLQSSRFLLKGLRDEAEAVDNKIANLNRGCMPHATSLITIPDGDSEQPEEKLICARTEGYKGGKREGFLHNPSRDLKRIGGCLVPQEQLNAWLHIHQQKPQRKGRPRFSTTNVESDCRKAYSGFKHSKRWKQLVVYKSGIHALGLYTSQFISHGTMVVEYMGEIVGLRVADRREREYQSGMKLQHKSACYFFRIDKEHIIDATRKGGIARFVNHSCQPNCVAKVISVRNEKKVVFFAERDIYPGEEITYDYHFSHEDEGEKIPCYCNSTNCRRFLN